GEDAGGHAVGAGGQGGRHRVGPRVGSGLTRREGLTADDVLGDLLAAGVVDLGVDVDVRRDAAGVGDGRLGGLPLAGGHGARAGPTAKLGGPPPLSAIFRTNASCRPRNVACMALAVGKSVEPVKPVT